MSRYLKMILAALGAVATWGITAGADEGYTDVELYGLLGAVTTALAVYAFPNRPPAGEASDPEISEQHDAGHVDGQTIVVGTVIVAAGLILGTLLLRLL